MIISIGQLIQTRDLLWAWTGRILRARYQQSILGGLWIVVQPVATAVLFAVIFTRFIPVDTGDIPYLVFSYAALTPWALLANSLNDMAGSLVDNMGLVTKIYFPREILPLAAVLARLVDFLVAYALLFVFMFIYRIPVFPVGLLFLPVILLVQLALIVGLGVALAVLNVFYRDVKPLLTLGIQLWFYASPIIYPVSMVPEAWRPLYYLNPMAGILQSYRDVLLYQTLPGPYLLVAAAEAVIALVIGYRLFKKLEFQVADVV